MVYTARMSARSRLLPIAALLLAASCGGTGESRGGDTLGDKTVGNGASDSSGGDTGESTSDGGGLASAGTAQADGDTASSEGDGVSAAVDLSAGAPVVKKAS